MERSPQERLIIRFAAISDIAGILIFFTGLTVLFGWVFNISILKSVLPGFVSMKVNTALLFILLGLSLRLVQEKRVNKNTRIIAMVCGIIIILVAALTLYEYAKGVNIGIDEIFLKDDPGAAFTTHPGRMAVTTAVSFILISAALLLLDVKVRRKYYPAQYLAIIVFLLSLLSMIGYLHGIKLLYFGIIGFTAMALHTAPLFFVISLGILFARPDKGVARVFTSDTIGGMIARRLIPIAAAIPPCIGLLNIWAIKTGIIRERFGCVLEETASIVIINGCIIWLVIIINRADIKRKNIEAVLIESEAKFRAVFDNAGGAIFIADTASEKIIECNPAAERLIGRRRSEIIGMRQSELHPKEESEKYRKLFLDHMTKGHPGDFEGEVQRSDGKRVNVWVSSQTLYLQRSEVSIGIFVDITEQKKAQEAIRTSEARLKAILDNSHAVVFLKDLEGRYMLINRRFEELFRVGREDMKRKTDYDIFPAEFAKAFQDTDRHVLETGHSIEVEEAVPQDDGNHYYITIKFPLFGQDGKPYAVCGIATDITERKKIESELKRNLHNLEVFYKASAGREERILELKKRVRELEEEKGN